MAPVIEAPMVIHCGSLREAEDEAGFRAVDDLGRAATRRFGGFALVAAVGTAAVFRAARFVAVTPALPLVVLGALAIFLLL